MPTPSGWHCGDWECERGQHVSSKLFVCVNTYDHTPEAEHFVYWCVDHKGVSDDDREWARFGWVEHASILEDRHPEWVAEYKALEAFGMLEDEDE